MLVYTFLVMSSAGIADQGNFGLTEWVRKYFLFFYLMK